MDRRKFIQIFGGSLLTPFVLNSPAQGNALSKLTLEGKNFSLNAKVEAEGLHQASHFSQTNAESVFDLSVASGDPSESGVILWTHIHESEYDGLSSLFFQVSRVEDFSVVEMEGQVLASDFSAERDYTVKLDLHGLLQAGSTYFYRFVYRNTVSRTGRCKTLPREDQALESLRIAVLTCQDYTTGFFNAYHHLAMEELDFVVHLGDFIYEYAQYVGFEHALVRSLSLPSGENVAFSLEDYRYIYRKFREDKNLQLAMERHTFIITWDDHETANDVYWDYLRDTLGAPDHPFSTDPVFDRDPDLLRQLKLDAQRAWLEFVPARIQLDESAEHPHDFLKIYRSFKIGNLVELFMTDSRTYRSEQPCKDGTAWENWTCKDYEAETQTMLGQEQKQWLIDGLTQSKARWKVWGNQTLLAQLAVTSLGHQIAYVNYDAWDGYQFERQEIMRAVKNNEVDNFVVLTGDLHTAIASYLKIDYGNINNWDYSNLVGIEVMTPSITSPNLQDNIANAVNINDDLRALFNSGARLNNPHIKDFNSSIYGYTVMEFGHKELRWDVFDIDKREDNPMTEKHLYRSFRYNPNWMWIY
ncbi:Alkaline phosphatase D [Thalassocella blandensis]|nr:Alkaline phosphatase D [Thalassocella blandensis]